MEVICPLCSHNNSDDWDCLQIGSEGPITCEACEKQFQLLVWECHKCEDHVAATWNGGALAAAQRPRMRCGSCGAEHGQDKEEISDEAEEG